MASKLEARLSKLEEQRKPKQSTNRIVIFNPNILGSKEAAFRNAANLRVMIVRDFGSDEEWEIALLKQQEQLCIIV